METDIFIVLDRSASMFPQKQNVIEGFNEWLASQQEREDSYVTLVQFPDNDTSWQRDRVWKATYSNLAVDIAPYLNNISYNPTGPNTPLYDSIMGVISLARKRIGNKLLIIITDGEENASVQYSYEQVAKKLEWCQESGWGVIFLASDLKVREQAIRLKMDQTNIGVYNGDARGAMQMAMAGTRSYYNSVGEGNLKHRNLVN